MNGGHYLSKSDGSLKIFAVDKVLEFTETDVKHIKL